MQNYLSSNIKFLRTQRKLSHEKLAKLSSVKEKHIIQIEKNGEDIALKELLALSKALDVSLDVLVNVNLEAKQNKARNIKLLVLDIDGVLTDGGMYYAENGDEFKKFNTKDGLAIKRLTKAGMQLAFLSNGKNSTIIQNRAKLLGVQRVYVGFDEKETVLNKWMKELKITHKNIAYIGDDVNDLKVISKAGFSACPADAVDAIKKTVHIILTRKGGDACVREAIDNYLS